MRVSSWRSALVAFVLTLSAALLTFRAAGQGDPIFVTNTPNQPAPLAATNTSPASATATASPTLTPSPTATHTPTVTPTPIGPSFYPEGVSPLTGLPYPSQEARERRNLLIKIANFPPIVRPQSGLNMADVVYEYEVEGGVTRFAAIYRSQAPRHVGPVRSGRLLDLELVPMYEALFAYSGASEPVQRLILDAPWALQVISPSIGDNCVEAGFCRFPGTNRVFEHTLYADTEAIWERATRRGVNTGYRARGFAFNETPLPGGEPVNDVFVNWYGQTDARWQYDADAERYVRYTEGQPHVDALDGEQLWADNLVIIEVPHEERPDLFEPESRSASQQINLWGSGRALVFRDGVSYSGAWSRANSEPGTALQLTQGSSQPILLRPGRTWVLVVRWLGDVETTTRYADMPATGTALAASFTPTPTLTPGPSQTPEATLAATPVLSR
jgi:hypothetical protein